MSEIDKPRRFRSMNGGIYSTSPTAFCPRLVQTRVREIMNELYDELCKYDHAAAEEICRRHNA